MKTHDQKMAEKAEHQAELERNDLDQWARGFWAKAKGGQIASNKALTWGLGILLVVAVGILLLRRGGGSGEGKVWQELEATRGTEKLLDFAKASPNSLPGKAARLQAAREQLGPQGIALLNNINPDTRGKAIKSIEDARTAFTALIGEFDKDLTLKAAAIDGAANAELALVGIPKEGTSMAAADYRGTVKKAAELFRQYASTVGEKAGASATKMAEQLEKRESEVLQLGRDLDTRMTPNRPQPPVIAPPSLTPAADEKK